MEFNFTIRETTTVPLWDFGWFELSHFTVQCISAEKTDSVSLLQAFLRHPISQKSFCEKGDVWGAPIGRRGPYLHDKIAVDWYRAVPLAGLHAELRKTLDHPDFDPLEPGQRAPLEDWVETLRLRGDLVFVLEDPGLPDTKVEFHGIWWVYREFITIRPDRQELSVGVLGYD